MSKNTILPDIPSGAEAKEKGLNIGDMQAKFLGKVEELTLHMIQAEERNNRLEQKVKCLEERLEASGRQPTTAASAPTNVCAGSSGSKGDPE